MKKKLKTYHPKGYTRLLFSDGSQILTKHFSETSRNSIEIANGGYEMMYHSNGLFAYWSKIDATSMFIYTPVARIYFK